MILYFIASVILAYLIGSVATAVWIGKLFYDIDVREHGSGNAGATNTFRVLGKRAGVPVLIIDAFKGWLGVKLAVILMTFGELPMDLINAQLILCVAVITGHILPVYVGFKGGKGVASLFGAVIAMHPYPALAAIGVFLIFLLITRYVSISSIFAGISFPLFIIYVFPVFPKSITMIIFSIIVAVLLIFTHRKNIIRLLKREETKANLFKYQRGGK